jgi:hypothetical protein
MPGSAALMGGQNIALPHARQQRQRDRRCERRDQRQSGENSRQRSKSEQITIRLRELRSADEPKSGASAIPGRNSPSSTNEIPQPE